MDRSFTFAEYLTTGCLGILSPNLTLDQALLEWGAPEGKDIHNTAPSPFTGDLVTQHNLYYGDLLLSFYGQQFYQYNLEVRYQTALGLPASLNAFWYKHVSKWEPKQFQRFLQRIHLASRCYCLSDPYTPNDKEQIIVIDSSKLYWFFDNIQLYKVYWTASRQ